MMKSVGLCTLVGLALAGQPLARAAITENQVLVVYNSEAADATALKDAYLAAHPGIPAGNVLNLNNAALNVSDVTQTQFNSLIRTPVRSYLLSGAPAPAPQDIVSIVLIRPFPHRVQDTDDPLVGDNPNAALVEFVNNGDATYASVDAEMVLLWQSLNSGEAGNRMDSRADNLIDNPYHLQISPISAFTRSNILTAKTFVNTSQVAWTLGGSGATRLTPGDMYLVCRIDGNSLADALACIDRAQGIEVNKAVVRVILDEYDETVSDGLDNDRLFGGSDPFFAGNDYEDARTLLSGNGWDVRYDDTFNFISAAEEPEPIIAYASYGENHSLNGAGESPPGVGTYIEGFNFAPGAIFNTIESFNGRALNGLSTGAGQEQVADFIGAGGTFGIGNVFEPFSFTVPDNEFLFYNMLVTRLSWGEAAYTCIPGLSWQQVVVGDPLGRYETIVSQPGDCDLDGQAGLTDFADFDGCFSGSGTPMADGCSCYDSDNDNDVDMLDVRDFQNGF